MTEMIYKTKINWENITKVLLYFFLFGIIIGLFYFLVAQPLIELFSNLPGGYHFGVENIFNMVV